MSLGNKLNKEVMQWGTLCIVVVIVSIILLKFKAVSGVTAGLNTTIDNFVTALSEPSNWVAIVIIALIGFGLLAYFQNRKKR